MYLDRGVLASLYCTVMEKGVLDYAPTKSVGTALELKDCGV
jgi:hypothetical protein